MQRNIYKTAAVLVTLVTIATAQIQPAAAQGQSLARTPSMPIGIGNLPSGEIPSGYVPSSCKPYVNKGPNAAYWLIDCYLSHPSNQNIAGSIMWIFNNQSTAWAQWPSWAKNDLVKAFKDTVAWYNGGMVKYPGVLVQDPPQVINEAWLKDHIVGAAVYDEITAAWPLYVGHIALNLASEIYAWVPWSLRNFDNSGLYHLLNYNSYFWPCNQFGATGYCTTLETTPANAVYAFKFFKTNDLIGPTKKETIYRVLYWSRRLHHTGCGSLSYKVLSMYFDHYGPPPVSRIIDGTVTTCPTSGPDAQVTPHNWTAGCHGTTGFLSTILRAVNIPVWYAEAGGGHLSPWFESEKLYLSHGDDPYGQDVAADLPASLIPIDEAKYLAWFPANNPVLAASNTGRRNYELNLKYPSPWVMNLYCSDVVGGKDHATGRVYNEYFKKYYTLADLENAGLWTLLDWKLLTYPCVM